MTNIKRINLPIPYGWYCVGYTDELQAGEVKPVRYFSQDLVLYRSLDGTACLSDAYCPHLGAHLGHGGTVEESGLVCPFHAWTFNKAGEVSQIPYASQIPPKVQGKVCLKMLPVVELSEFIFAWYHPHGEAPLFELQPFEELESGGWTACQRRQWHINTHVQETGENAVDLAHFPTVHNTGDMQMNADVSFEGPKRDSIIHVGHQRIDSEGSIAEKDTETVYGKIHSVNIGPGQTWNRNYGIDLLMIGLPTPIEHDLMEFRFACSVPKADAEANAEINRLIFENAFEQIDQDIPIWENKIYKVSPALCDGDGPIAKYRKWFQQFYEV